MSSLRGGLSNTMLVYVFRDRIKARAFLQCHNIQLELARLVLFSDARMTLGKGYDLMKQQTHFLRYIPGFHAAISTH